MVHFSYILHPTARVHIHKSGLHLKNCQVGALSKLEIGGVGMGARLKAVCIVESQGGHLCLKGAPPPPPQCNPVNLLLICCFLHCESVSNQGRCLNQDWLPHINFGNLIEYYHRLDRGRVSHQCSVRM